MVRWGILGLGKIAEKFAEAIQEVENAELIAISSLENKKLNFFGKKHNIVEKYRFNTYENLLNCDEVDAVYIATLNNTHAELIIKSAKAKKNILCEKPMSLNYKEAIEVFNQLKKSKVFFSEAFAYRYHPQTEIITNLIKNDETVWESPGAAAMYRSPGGSGGTLHWPKRLCPSATALPSSRSKTLDGSNFFLTFGDFLANFERLVLGCIETNLCK